MNVSLNQVFNTTPVSIFSKDDLAGHGAGIVVYFGSGIEDGSSIFFPKNPKAGDILSGREAVVALSASSNIEIAQSMVDAALGNGKDKSTLKLSFHGLNNTNVSEVCPNITLADCAKGQLAKQIATLFSVRPH